MRINLDEIVLPFLSSGLFFTIAFAVLYYFRDQLTTYLHSRIKHKFNRELETLRSELARDRETLQALRVGALGVRAQRQSIIDQRRVEAVDQLWAAVKELNKLRWICGAMASVKWPEAAEMAATDVRAQRMFQTIAGNKTNEKVSHGAHGSRPYVSPLAWALFSTMQTVLGFSLMQMTVLRTGVGPEIVADQEKIFAPIIAALPDFKDIVEKHGHTSFPFIVEILEERILNELRKTLDGGEADAAEVRRASEIERLVREAKPPER